MERRNVLYGAATMLAGAALPSIGNEPSARPQPRNSLARPARFPYLETGERTSLFCKDWGSSERVVVFVHGWPFHSDMWQYQMFHLASAGVPFGNSMLIADPSFGAASQLSFGSLIRSALLPHQICGPRPVFN